MRSGTHFLETDLLELYAETCGNDAPLHPHLAGCPGCAARYAALVEALQEHGEQVSAEADRLFTAERLARQCERILQRIDVGRFARVIPFPVRSAADGITMLGRGSMARLVSRRWVAAAAAAGLVLGFFAERVIRNSRTLDFAGPRVARQATPRLSPAIAQATPHLVSYEDAILDEIDAVLAGQPAQELHALDAITPPGLR